MIAPANPELDTTDPTRRLDLTMPVQPRGSAQCRTCGKFCRIVGGSHLFLEDSWAVVDCPQHGRSEV